MKQRFKASLGIFMLLAAPAFGAGSEFVAEDSDLVSIRGQGEISIVHGTVIHMQSEDGEWYGLFSRNQGSTDITLSVEDGTYYVETWSIAPNPMNPQRIHQGFEVEIGDGSNEPNPGYGSQDLLLMLDNWGDCTGQCEYDLNGDGSVGVPDLLIMMANWG